jgi:3-hydroxyisobutyrate dehydrogenase
MTSQLAVRPFGPQGNPGHGRPATPVIAFLGTGRMGGPMAANLARAGLPVRAWDRTASHAAALVTDGATVAASPAEAVRGAGILITMLADGPATDQVWHGPGGLAAAAPGLIWVQMATVGPPPGSARPATAPGPSWSSTPGSPT